MRAESIGTKALKSDNKLSLFLKAVLSDFAPLREIRTPPKAGRGSGLAQRREAAKPEAHSPCGLFRKAEYLETFCKFEV